MLKEILTGVYRADADVTPYANKIQVDLQFLEHGSGLSLRKLPLRDFFTKNDARMQLADRKFVSETASSVFSTVGVTSALVGLGIITGRIPILEQADGWMIFIGGMISMRVATELYSLGRAFNAALEDVDSLRHH